MTTDSTSTVLQQRGAATWTRATEHPMVKEIATGVLPHSTFRRYFEQNILYLEEYVRAIGLTIGKAPDHDAMVVLGRFLLQIADLEIPANHDFLTRLGGDPSTLDHHQMNATTHGYTRHLLHVAGSGDCAAGLTAILPCQWSYGALARPLMESLPSDPIYDDWIAMFGSDDYDDLVGAHDIAARPIGRPVGRNPDGRVGVDLRCLHPVRGAVLADSLHRARLGRLIARSSLGGQSAAVKPQARGAGHGDGARLRARAPDRADRGACLRQGSRPRRASQSAIPASRGRSRHGRRAG